MTNALRIGLHIHIVKHNGMHTAGATVLLAAPESTLILSNYQRYLSNVSNFKCVLLHLDMGPAPLATELVKPLQQPHSIVQHT